MKRLCLLLLLPLSVFAETYSYTDPNGSYVRLFDEPCEVSTGWLKMKKAQVRWQGKDYSACWMPHRQYVLILDDAGDFTPLPVAVFKKDEGV